jgi:uncharacterized surface protein with fasciclin (FAS1) repeats
MPNIVDTAVAAGNFTMLADALMTTGLINTLKGAGPFTVFAPTDEAFQKIDPETMQDLKNDPEELKKLLLFHVVSGDVRAAQVLEMDGAQVATVNGEKVTVSVSDDHSKVMVNDANVIQTDIVCDNGVIHAIDMVLVP